MKKLLLLTLIAFSCSLNAIFDDYEPSAHARALGGTYYSIGKDASSIFYNPAGLYESKRHIQADYTSPFGNEFQKLYMASYAMPTKYGSFAFGMQAMQVEFEDLDLMSEQILSIAHAFQMLKDFHSKINFGYSFNFYHLEFDEFGDDTSFGLNMGINAILFERIRTTAFVQNINNPSIGKDKDELPRKLVIGTTYEPYQNINTTIELHKGLNDHTILNETEIHFGIEYLVHELLQLRVGLRNKPDQFSCGAGIFPYKNLIIDYAFQSHAVLGGTHHFGIGYRL